MTDSVCPKCGSTSFTVMGSHRVCDGCDDKSAAPTGTLDDFKKKVSVPKPPRPPKPSKPRPKRKMDRKSAPLAQMHLYEKGKSRLNFIHQFQMYSDFLTDACLDYSFWNAALMLGHVMGYNTIHLIQPGEIFHNLYMILVGQSTVSRKTTSQEKSVDVYPNERIAMELTSPEAFFEEMSNNPELIVFYDEFSGFLKGVTKKGGYQSRFVELFNRLYKPSLKPIKRKLRGSDSEQVIDKGYLSFHATVTEEMLTEFVTKELGTGGFLVRYLLVYGSGRERPRERVSQKAIRLREGITHTLERMIEFAKHTGKDGSRDEIFLAFSDEALDRLEEVSQKTKKYGREVAAFAGRYMDNVVKVADILLFSDAIGLAQENDMMALNNVNSLNELLEAAGMAREKMEGRNVWIVDAEYVDRAWFRVEKCLSYAKTIAAYLEYDPQTAKLRYRLEMEDTPISRTDLTRLTRIKSKELPDAIQTLVLHGFLLTFQEEKEYKDRDRTSTTNYYCTSIKIGKSGCKKCKFAKECKDKYFELWESEDNLSA